MKDPKIKKLAKLTIVGSLVDRDVANYVLRNLPRKSLLIYLSCIKSIYEKNLVTIQSEQQLPVYSQKQIKRMFGDKFVVFEQRSGINGIRVQIRDTIIDLSMEQILSQTIDGLKN